MSSTNRGADRIALDAYYTPDAVARACVATLAGLAGATVWEPSAGGGAFAEAAALRHAFVYASDISPILPPMEELEARGIAGWRANHDAIKGWPFGDDPPAWIIGNPPFNDAEQHTRMALATATVGVAFLLRLAFLEGAKRRDFWRQFPASQVYVFVNRPSFTGGATDSCAYGWFVWWKGHEGQTTLHHLEWR